MGRPYRPFYSDREECFLMPPAAFKIWMYHYKCEAKDRRESWPSLETLMAKCDLSKNTVTKNRKWLIDNGWLVKLRVKRTPHGHFSIPVFKVRRGTIPQEVVSRVDTADHNMGLGVGPVDQELGNGVPTVDQNLVCGDDAHRDPEIGSPSLPKNCATDAAQNLGTEVMSINQNPNKCQLEGMSGVSELVSEEGADAPPVADPAGSLSDETKKEFLAFLTSLMPTTPVHKLRRQFPALIKLQDRDLNIRDIEEFWFWNQTHKTGRYRWFSMNDILTSLDSDSDRGAYEQWQKCRAYPCPKCTTIEHPYTGPRDGISSYMAVKGGQ